MFGIAGGVFRVFEIKCAVIRPFGTLTLQEAVALCGGNVGDESLFGFEVERHLFAVVQVRSLFVDRLAL